MQLPTTSGAPAGDDDDPRLGGCCGDDGFNLDISVGLELALPLRMVGGGPPARAPSFPSRGALAPSCAPPPSPDPATPWWLVGCRSR
jgi:hypothetical protein